MQTVKRYAYALASYDEKSQSHDTYAEKKALLEECCNNIRKNLPQKDAGTSFIAVNAAYSAEKNISICCYKNTLFVGFQDKETKQISLNDASNSFISMPSMSPGKLEERMINAIADAEKNRPNLMSQQLQTLWKPLIPVLDKIIQYESEFEKLPRFVQDSLDRRGGREADINRIINNTPLRPEVHKEDRQPLPEFKNPHKENTEKKLCDISFSERCALAKKTSAELKENQSESLHTEKDTKEKGDSDIADEF